MTASVLFTGAGTMTSPEKVLVPAMDWPLVRSTKFCVVDPVPPSFTGSGSADVVTRPVVGWTWSAAAACCSDPHAPLEASGWMSPDEVSTCRGSCHVAVFVPVAMIVRPDTVVPDTVTPSMTFVDPPPGLACGVKFPFASEARICPSVAPGTFSGGVPSRTSVPVSVPPSAGR